MRLSRCSLRAHNSLLFLLLYFRIFKLLYTQYLIFKITQWGSWASLVSKFSSVQSLSHVWLCNPMDRPPCPSPTPGVYPNSCPLNLVMPSNHLILCCPLFHPPSIFPSIRVFSNESVLHIRWPKYWSFSFSISPSNEYSVLISFRILKEMGIPDHLTCLLRNLYAG